MRTALLLAVAWYCATLLCLGQVTSHNQTMTLTYELYSWQDSSGRWYFQLLPPTNRQKTVAEVFRKKSALGGLDQLKKKIGDLPVSSSIVWFDRLTLGGVRVKGSERLAYPPKEVIDEVSRCAATRKITISGPEHAAP